MPKKKDYSHSCKDLDETSYRIENNWESWAGRYSGWLLISPAQESIEYYYPDAIPVKFCPYCGEKLPEIKALSQDEKRA